MLEAELCSSRVISPSREESGDEELSVLPRHTKVIVTGNNRTKSVLVGLQGVVKKAVGLGGWHWLVIPCFFSPPPPPPPPKVKLCCANDSQFFVWSKMQCYSPGCLTLLIFFFIG